MDCTCNKPECMLCVARKVSERLTCERLAAEVDALVNRLEFRPPPTKIVVGPLAVLALLEQQKLWTRAAHARNGGFTPTYSLEDFPDTLPELIRARCRELTAQVATRNHNE